MQSKITNHRSVAAILATAMPRLRALRGDPAATLQDE